MYVKNYYLSTLTLLAAFVLLISVSIAQPPANYYSSATGTGFTLKTQLHNIIKGHTVRQYCQLWTDFQSTDKRPDGKVWDMYSNCNFTFGVDQDNGTGGSAECQKYNREHTFPQSWFGSSISGCGTNPPLATDLFMVYPTDKYVNAQRGNLPYGMVATANQTYSNEGKRGTSSISIPGYSGNVYEPANEYKGDLARTFFYIATRYQDVIANWQNLSTEGNAVLDGTSERVFENWCLQMLYQWHIQDPVSQKEIDRNNAVFAIQGNRNPFIDNPQWVATIWGLSSSTTPTISFENATGSITEGNSGTKNYTVNVRINPAPASNATVQVALSSTGTTAQQGTDFTFTSPQTLTFTNSITMQTITIVINGDTDIEPNETVRFILQNNSTGTAIGTPDSHTLTILNDEIAPTFQFSTVSGTISEGNAGTKTYTTQVSVSPTPTGTVTVDVALNTAGTTAQQGTDFVFASPQTLTFTNTVTTQNVSITINGDTELEEDEEIGLVLQNNSPNTLIGDIHSHTVTIQNDEVPTYTVSFVNSTNTVERTTAGSITEIPVTISPNPISQVPVQITLNTTGTTAQASEYGFSNPTTLTFSPGVNTLNAIILVQPSTTPKPPSTVKLDLQTASNVVLGTNPSYTLNLVNTVSNLENLEENIRIFPNYVSDWLHIQNISNTHISKVQIWDKSGKILYESSPQLAEISIPIVSFVSGTYVLSLQVGKQALSKQVVVIR